MIPSPPKRDISQARAEEPILVAVVLALKKKDLTVVAVASCGAVFLTEQLLLLF